MCLLTPEIVGLIFYKYSILLSILLALLAGAFTVVAFEAHRKMKKEEVQQKEICDVRSWSGKGHRN